MESKLSKKREGHTHTHARTLTRSPFVVEESSCVYQTSPNMCAGAALLTCSDPQGVCVRVCVACCSVSEWVVCSLSLSSL